MCLLLLLFIIIIIIVKPIAFLTFLLPSMSWLQKLSNMHVIFNWAHLSGSSYIRYLLIPQLMRLS